MFKFSILLAPPLIFFFYLLIGLFFYFLGNKIAPVFDRDEEKLKSYACGEDIPNQQVPFSYQDFFRIALFYTVMEVGVLIIATVPDSSNSLWALIFLLVVTYSVLILLFSYD